ncbi:MAG: restriction endonuclease subunit S [Candidatus Cloacimonetes bacterium]|nr:restriction endonuclease subunit S [Candidatus Cloacimonadota bacterium]
MGNEITVGDFCPFIYGKGLPARLRNTSGSIPVYGSNGIIGKHDKSYTKGPTVVIGRKGTVGAIHYSPVPCWPIDTTFYIEYSDPLDARFSYYLLQTLGLELMNSDSAVPGLNRNAAHLRRIPLHNKAYRHSIAFILGSLDDKIELNLQINKTLEDTAQAIFKNWFSDFDPVHAKAAGKQPIGLNPEIAALFPDSFVDSELGQIPKGWSISRLDEYFKLTMGQSPPGRTYNEEGLGIPFFQGRSDFGFRFPKKRVFCSAPKRFANKGDTLVTVRAPVGDINMALELCAIGRGVASVRHKTGSSIFTYYTMNQLRNSFTRFEAEGSVFGTITKTDFLSLPIIAPPIQLIETYTRLFGVLENSIECNELQSMTLISIRDTLLPKLISGNLKIRDAEKIVGGCI